MDRTVGSGWGSSAVGAWRVIEGASSVTGDVALLASRKPGITARASVTGVSAADVDSKFSLSIPKLPVGGPIYLAQAVRVSGKDSYGVRVRVHPDGSAYVSVVRLTDLTGVQSLAERRLPVTVKSGTSLDVAFRVTGTNPRRPLGESLGLGCRRAVGLAGLALGCIIRTPAEAGWIRLRALHLFRGEVGSARRHRRHPRHRHRCSDACSGACAGPHPSAGTGSDSGPHPCADPRACPDPCAGARSRHSRDAGRRAR